MQIVIDMPEGTFESVKRYYEQNQDCYALCAYVANGTPLPKGHGRLIDADYVTKDLNTLQDSFVINISNAKPGALTIACCAPTIIEADAIAESEVSE